MDKKAAEIIRRWVVLQRYSLGTANTADVVIDKMFRDLQKTLSVSNYDRVINSIVKSSQKDLEKIFMSSFKIGVGTFIGAEAIAYGLKPIPVTRKMVNKALATPLSGQNLAPVDIFSDMLRGVQRKTSTIITRGINEGRSLTVLRRELSELSYQSKNAIDAFSRTSINAVANQGKNDLYYANSDIADRYMWLSALDHRTSDTCIALDRKVFKLHKGPSPPAHVNCRSTTIPIKNGESIRSMEKAFSPRPAVEPKKGYKKGDIRTRTGKVRKPRKGGPLRGTTSTARNYEAWIKQQPIAYQRDVLGIKATDALHKGVPLTTILKSRSSALSNIGLEKALN